MWGWQSITLDSPETIGNLVLGNSGSPNVGYTLSGSGSDTLTFSNSGSGATITVTNGSHVINAPVFLADNLMVSGIGTLAFGNSSSIAGGYSLSMNLTGGALILSGAETYTGGTNVNAGTLVVKNNTALPDGTSVTVGAGGTFIFDPSAAVTSSPSLVAVPEPSTTVLSGIGTIASLRWVWRRKKQSALESQPKTETGLGSLVAHGDYRPRAQTRPADISRGGA